MHGVAQATPSPAEIAQKAVASVFIAKLPAMVVMLGARVGEFTLPNEPTILFIRSACYFVKIC